MSQWQDISPRPETANLHARILAAAIRNGHTPHSFRHACVILTLRERVTELMDDMGRAGPWVRVAIGGKPSFVWSGE